MLGDMVRVSDGDGGLQALPGVAPVAIQQGVYAARLITDRLRGREERPFHYVDKGNLATIGRGRAVADLPLVRLSGLPAWVIWLVVHIWYLIGFQNRLVVILRWSISFLTSGRAQGSRIISREDWYCALVERRRAPRPGRNGEWGSTAQRKFRAIARARARGDPRV